ncbi:hypothetical protein Q3G72_009269 [Acer saccharum]|nr:hypothetical protein Q3G72_009269 [Acer saccharum]
MQADEDVGKIALAVPVLVSKALELFLQDLCDHTYEITLQRGAKTMNALHLKNYVQSYNVFDFLRDIVGKVPDYGHGHSDVATEDRSISKRRKAAGDEYNDSDEESKRSKMVDNGSKLKEPLNENDIVSDATNPATRNFDLNVDLNVNMDSKATAALANAPTA